MPSGETDIVIIGSGIGGATIAAGLADCGRKITILERGQKIGQNAQARDPISVFKNGTFHSKELWETPDGKTFKPGNYYYVGGNSKLFGAVFFRYRAEDFSPIRHLDGVTRGWPISYDTLEPWYQRAEELYEVRGQLGTDPSEPEHSKNYGFPPIPHEATIRDVAERLKKVGVTPSSLPLGLDVEEWLKGGQTGWDAFPNTGIGKKDAEVAALAKAVKSKNVKLKVGSKVQKLIEGAEGKIEYVEYEKDGETHRLKAKLVILSAGAVNSAALLLNSANEKNPKGLANGSDQVGRNFMNHNASAVMALHPLRKNTSIYQKTLYFNDFYLRGGPDDMPLGNVQLLGKITAPILQARANMPSLVAQWITSRSVDWYVMSEDLPNPESRVTLRNNRIVLDWKRSNWQTHVALVKKTKQVLRQAGYPILLSKPFDRSVPSHQCGTARFGDDPNTNVLDTYCRAHEHDNLYVMDASFLPTSAAVNPSLTIAAQALRVADHIIERGAY